MENNIIDLHMHSFYSDGEFSPTELVKRSRQVGLKYIALADHNSVRGVEEAVREGKKQDVTVIPAIEIDCTYKDVNLHILGYYIDPTLEEFAKLEEDIIKQEQKLSFERVKLIEKAGIYVNHDKLNKLVKNGIVIPEDIGEASINEPENKDNPLIQVYLEGGSRSDNPFVNFYWDLCAQEKIAYVHIEFISLKDAVALIKKAGGIPVFAHPGNNIKMDEKLLSGIMNEGVEGLEIYSSYHTDEQISFYKKKATEGNWLVTCGSDYHGKIKPAISLGGSKCPQEVQSTIVENIIR